MIARTASPPHPERPLWSRAARLVLGAVFFLLPLAHSAGLSDPFDLPKEALVCGGALLLLACMVFASARGAGVALRGAWPVAAATLLALGGAALAAARSAFPGIAASGFLTLAALVVVAAAVPLAVRRPVDALLLMVAAVAGLALAALASLAQIFRPGFNLAIGELSIVPPAPAGGTFGDPGLLAQALLVGLPLGVGAAALLAGPARLALGAGLGVVAAALLYGGRPEGWIAAGGVIAILLATRVMRAVRRGGEAWSDLVPDPAGQTARAILAAGAVVALALAVARLPGMGTGTAAPAMLSHVGLLAPTTGEVAADRAAGTTGTLALLGRHPLGTGPGTWRHAFLEVAWTAVPSSPFTLSHQAVHAGQSFLEAGAELGLVGGAALLFLAGLALSRAARTSLRERGEWGTVAAAAFAALLAAGLVAFFGSPFQEPVPAALVALACGLAFAAYRQVSTDAATPIASARARVATLAAGLAALVGFAAVLALLLPLRIQAARLTLAGQALLGTGDARGALQLLSLPAARRAADHLPHALRGQAAVRLGAYQVASDAFGDTLKRSPFFVSGYLGRAGAEEMLGHYDRAASDLDAALALWPGSYDILMARGRLNARRGRLEQAMVDYQEAAKAGAKAGDPWFALGEILLRRGENDRAAEAFHLCLQRNPRFPHVNLALAAAYEKRGMNDMAIAHLQREAAIDDRAVEPRLRLANLFHKEMRECDARDALVAARDLETDPDQRARILEILDRMETSCALEKKRRG